MSLKRDTKGSAYIDNFPDNLKSHLEEDIEAEEGARGNDGEHHGVLLRHRLRRFACLGLNQSHFNFLLLNNNIIYLPNTRKTFILCELSVSVE